jgi:hypothetical protein
MVQHGRLEYADDGAPMLTFPASVIRYPEKKPKTTRRCNARRGAK